jgi:hypothetical protein
MIAGPAGTRCPECASLRTSHLYRVSPVRLPLLVGIGVVAGVIGSQIVEFFSFFFFFFLIMGAFAYGGAVAEIMLKAIGRKQNTVAQVTGTASLVVGWMLPAAFLYFRVHGTPLHMLADWRQLLAVVCAAIACSGRLRFM